MSQESVEIVRRTTGAYNRRDLDGMLAHWAQDAVLDWSNAHTFDAGVYRGHGEIRAFLEGFLATWDEVRLEIVDGPLEVEDDLLITENVAYLRGRDGIEVRARSAWLHTFRDGEQTSLALYQTKQEALDAAGISESAMVQEGVDTFNRANDAYNRRDVEALLETLDPEIEWYSALMVPMGGKATVFRGYEGIRELFRGLDEVLDDWRAEYPEIRDLGDRIVGIGRVRTRGRGSGAETESPIATVCDIRDGKAFRIRTYLDPKEALEAAVLRE